MSLTDSSSTPVGDGASQYSPTPAPTSIYAAAQQPPPHTPRNVTYTLSTIITVIDEPPSYRPSLQDGTLLTSTYIAAARDMTVFLFVGGIVLAVFLRNIVVAAKYLRTVAARDKSLFYLLFFAQIWGPIAVLAMLLPIAVESVNCTAYVFDLAAAPRRAGRPAAGDQLTLPCHAAPTSSRRCRFRYRSQSSSVASSESRPTAASTNCVLFCSPSASLRCVPLAPPATSALLTIVMPPPHRSRRSRSQLTKSPSSRACAPSPAYALSLQISSSFRLHSF